MTDFLICPQDVNVLICCEHTRALSVEFEKLGFNVTSCDFKNATSPSQHYTGNVFDIVPGSFHVLIGFPPCTYLAKAGIWRFHNDLERTFNRNEGLSFVRRLFALDIPFIALENPIGHLNTHWRQPSQLVQPYFFGDPYIKEICLWLKGLPALMSSAGSPSRTSVSTHVNGRMSQSQKSEIRSSWLHYPNMCKSIAAQWGASILKDFNSSPVLRNMVSSVKQI